MTPKIAVLITSHNRKTTTLLCLDTLMGQTGLNNQFELSIFLVDDGSTDGTGAAVSKHYPNVKIIVGSGDLYWNRGMYLAWSEAIKIGGEFDYFLWLNDDVALYKDTLSHLLDCASESSSKAIICGLLETSNLSQEISYGGGNLINGKYISNYPSTTLESCEIINGNCVLIPYHVYKIVGKLNPIYPHSLGDHDYSLTAKKIGIISFTSKKFIGYCEKNSSLPAWCIPDNPFVKRVKSLYSPLGNSHPYYYFIYIKKHFGIIKALKNLITIHLRLLFPRLWKQ